MSQDQLTLALTKLTLKQVTFEVRYPSAFLFWDRAGAIAYEFQQRWPKMDLRKAEPGNIVFNLEETEVSIGLDKAHIIAFNPRSDLEDVTSLADFCIDTLRSILNVDTYSRVGLRLIHQLKFPTMNEAAEAVIRTGAVRAPTGKHFNIEGTSLNPEFTMRWESQKLGIRVSLAAQTEKVDFDPPFGIDDLNPIHIENHTVKYDVDYYTRGDIGVGQLKAAEWIGQTYHLIKRDSKVFLEGTQNG